MRAQTKVQWLMVTVCVCGLAAAAGAAQVIYVDAAAGGAGTGATWQDACPHLQDALALAAAAPKPVEIRVAQGVYKPDQGTGITPGDWEATFQLLSGVTVCGGYAGVAGPDPDARDITLHETTLSGDLLGGASATSQSHNIRNVVTGSGTDRTAVLDGFTITGGWTGVSIDAGSPTIRHCRLVGRTGWGAPAALMANHASSPLLADCTFPNNSTGVYNRNGSHSVVTNCRFEGNRQGMENFYSSPVITGCRFTDNQLYAIFAWDCNSVLTDCMFEGDGTGKAERGIHGVKSNLSLTGCTFTGLSGGCIDTSGGDLSLFRCAFTGNLGFSEGAVSCFGDLTARECSFVGNRGGMGGAVSASRVELYDCEFSGNSSMFDGAVEARGDVLIATNCLFCGNSSRQGVGAVSSRGALLLSNCTFIGNRGQPSAVDHRGTSAFSAELKQCIVWDGPNPFTRNSATPPRITATYSDIQGGYPGAGNIDVDPCFVDPGYWADPDDPAVAARPDDPCALWVAGDYHLRSQGGHWDRAGETWVRDEITSLCVDAGDPNGPLGEEPFPNGGYVNLGAYGGTSEASKSYFGEPICEVQIAGDVNGDCKVDQTDMDILRAHWLMEGTIPINIPPTVTLISPADNAELTYPAQILFQAAASDPDGTVVQVTYYIQYRTEHSVSTSGTGTSDPANNWDMTGNWSHIHNDGKYTVWAEALDNEGARTVSPKITVTFHLPK